MKQLRNPMIMILAACIALSYSCQKESNDTLSVTPTTIQFAAGETSTKTATVATKADWYASPSVSWLSLEQEGKTLSIAPVSLNNSDSERTATVVVVAGNADPVQISVTQAITQVSLSVSSTSLTFGANETTAKSVTVTTSAKIWSVYTPDTWITCEQEGNLLVVKPTGANTASSERTATVSVRAGNAGSISVSVTQSAAAIAHSLSVSPNNITFGASETATRTATVTTNAPSWNASTTASWLSLSQSGNSLRITPTGSNTSTSQRSATINVTAGNANPVTVQVTQSGTSTSSTLNFNDIVNSSYTATGTPPAGLTNPAPGSWSGNLYVNSANLYYSISNWANISEYPLWVDYDNGKLYIDNYSIVRTTGDLDFFFVVGYLEGNTFTSKATNYEYEVSYNKTTRTLDFTGMVDGHTALVALGSINKTTQQRSVYSNTILSNAKLVLTPAASSAPGTRSAASSGGKSGKVINAPEKTSQLGTLER